jgi:hypothetical protein
MRAPQPTSENSSAFASGSPRGEPPANNRRVQPHPFWVHPVWDGQALRSGCARAP